MDSEKLETFEKKLQEYNLTHRPNDPILHINTTFEKLAGDIEKLLAPQDYEMSNILKDYREYLDNDHLIPNSWKYMKMHRVGTTIDYNIENNLYYNGVERGFSSHDYLGLYTNKSVRAIGKICAIITAVENNGSIKYNVENGELTEERKNKISQAIEDAAPSFGYNLRTNEHRYFFVEQFFKTDFKKTTPRAPMGDRKFDLTEILEINALPETKEIAEKLKEKTWG